MLIMKTNYHNGGKQMKNNNREYRNMEMRTSPQIGPHSVEGYASTFEPYVLFRDEETGIDYSEQIRPTAFDGADLSDVVFRVDHEGAVYARTSAGTLEVNTDEHGLAICADLSKTQRARELYEDIKAGNYPKMSFAFVVADGGDEYDRETHTRIIHRVAKVFDISPVSFPANPNTAISVSTRSYFDGVIEAERAERLEAERREKQKQKIRILTEVNA
jgi:HK97 family phage prohead protease